MYTHEQLVSANLPVKKVWEDALGNLQAEFERELTHFEARKFEDISNGILTYAIALSPSQQIILADGEDVAEITISGEPNTQVAYTINGVEQTVTLDDSGTDKIELTCDSPNTTLLVQAGTAKAVIYAVEVPS